MEGSSRSTRLGQSASVDRPHQRPQPGLGVPIPERRRLAIPNGGRRRIGLQADDAQRGEVGGIKGSGECRCARGASGSAADSCNLRAADMSLIASIASPRRRSEAAIAGSCAAGAFVDGRAVGSASASDVSAGAAGGLALSATGVAGTAFDVAGAAARLSGLAGVSLSGAGLSVAG